MKVLRGMIPIAMILAGCSNDSQDFRFDCIIIQDESVEQLCTGREYRFDFASDSADVETWVVASTGIGRIEIRREKGKRLKYFKSEFPGEADVIVFGSPEFGRNELCRRHFTFVDCP
jgi:hypothetical protein